MKDLNRREVSALAPLFVLIVVLGFYPQPLLDVINPAVGDTLQQVGVSDPPPDVPGVVSDSAKEESHQ